MTLPYIKVFTDYLDATAELSDSEKGRLYDGLLNYARSGEVPQLTGNERFVFPLLKNQVDRDRAEYAAKVKNGKKGGRPSKNRTKPNKTEGNQDEEEDQDEEEEEDSLSDFDLFWQAYPRKAGKGDARSAFDKAMTKGVTLTKILAAVAEQKGSQEWSDPQYIPHPSTWLNQERWDDELTPLPNQNQETPPPPLRVEERFIDGEWVTVEVKE